MATFAFRRRRILVSAIASVPQTLPFHLLQSKESAHGSTSPHCEDLERQFLIQTPSNPLGCLV